MARLLVFLCLALAATAAAVDAQADAAVVPSKDDADAAKVAHGGWRSFAKGVGFAPAFVNGLGMTIATELGDKTFCIAAVMAMRYNRILVFSGSVLALLVMTVLSVAIGVAVPAVLPKAYTHYAAAALFAYFGIKLLQEARAMAASGTEEHGELAEAEAEVADKVAHLKNSGVSSSGSGSEGGSTSGGDIEALTTVSVVIGSSSAALGGNGGAGSGNGSGRSGTNGGGGGASPNTSPASSVGGTPDSESDTDPSAKSLTTKRAAKVATGGGASSSGSGSGEGSLSSAGRRLATLSRDCPIFTTAFTVTFLAEWGDRSQIATIAMAAAQDPVGVCIGSMLGHSLCTGLAVVGGRLLASRISERAVAFFGGLLFIAFAFHSFIVGPDVDE